MSQKLISVCSKNLPLSIGHFLIAQVNYNEVTFDQATEQIVFAEYIPLTGLLNEVIEKVTQGTIAATQCAACQRYADMNKEDGIFGDTANLERFYLSGMRPDALSLGLLSAVSQAGLIRGVRKQV